MQLGWIIYATIYTSINLIKIRSLIYSCRLLHTRIWLANWQMGQTLYIHPNYRKGYGSNKIQMVLCHISKCLCSLYFVPWIVEIAKPDCPQQSVEDVEASRIPNHPQPGLHVSVYLMALCGLRSLSLKL